MNYSERLAQFEQDLAAVADLAFLPISADLQYLTGVPRDLPTFGWTMHPGAWLEGLWLRPGARGCADAAAHDGRVRRAAGD